MKRTITLLPAVIMLFIAAVTASAQEPSLHGYLRHQIGVAANDTQIVSNGVTADVEISYRTADVDLLVHPSFMTTPGEAPRYSLREAYLDYYTRFVDIRVGKHIIIWGKADGLAVTDIVSPKDLSNFLIPEFDELRVGVAAAQATAYLGPVTVELVYIPIFTPSVLPAPGSIWYTSLDTPIVPTINTSPEVGVSLTDGEFYGRIRLQTSAFDVDLAGGYYWTNEPSPTITKEFSSPGVLSALTVTPTHSRQGFVGSAIGSSAGPFILRGESGYFTPKRFLTTDMADTDGYVEKDYLQSLAGVDTVFVGVDLSAQVMHQYVLAHDDALQQDEHTWTATLRARKSLLRERVVVDAFSIIGFNGPDALIKLGATWTPVDALSFRAEGNLFFGDAGQFGSYDENDLVVVSTRYSY